MSAIMWLKFDIKLKQIEIVMTKELRYLRVSYVKHLYLFNLVYDYNCFLCKEVH